MRGFALSQPSVIDGDVKPLSLLCLRFSSTANSALSWFGAKVKETLAARVGSAGVQQESSSTGTDSFFPAAVPLPSSGLVPYSASTRPPLSGIAEGDEGEALAAAAAATAAVAAATAVAPEGAPPALPRSEGAAAPQLGASPFM